MSLLAHPPAAGYFANLLNGGLLKSEKHAQREGFWAAHVLRPRGAQSQGVAPERRLFPIQQTTVTEACEIRCDCKALLQTRRWALRAPAITQASVAVLCWLGNGS